MNSVFEPSVLFISEKDWINEVKRDKFLDHLLNHLQEVHNLNIVKILWTERFEELFWSDPQLPPWRQQRDWKLKLVPVISKLLNQNKEFMMDAVSNDPCSVIPKLNFGFSHSDIEDYFFSFIHHLKNRNINVFLCLGLDNHLSFDGKYIFSCNCHNTDFVPVLIQEVEDWAKYSEPASCYWPSSENEIYKLEKALDLTAKAMYGITSSAFYYDCEFSQGFLKRIVKENDLTSRKEFLEALTKRLLLNPHQASKHRGLGDEQLKGNNSGIRRFRISKAKRIHYIYGEESSEKAKIKFIDYYSDGEHDDGL